MTAGSAAGASALVLALAFLGGTAHAHSSCSAHRTSERIFVQAAREGFELARLMRRTEFSTGVQHSFSIYGITTVLFFTRGRDVQILIYLDRNDCRRATIVYYKGERISSHFG